MVYLDNQIFLIITIIILKSEKYNAIYSSWQDFSNNLNRTRSESSASVVRPIPQVVDRIPKKVKPWITEIQLNCSGPITVGPKFFDQFLLHNDLFVDKSLLIKELLEKNEYITVITRPRRFGKSLNLDMLRKFFGLELITKTGQLKAEEDKQNYKLFLGGEFEYYRPLHLRLNITLKKTMKPLRIAEHKKIVNDHMGKYPIVYVNFFDLWGFTYKEVYNKTSGLIRSTLRDHSYLLHYFNDTNSPSLNFKFRKMFFIACQENNTRADIVGGLRLLTELLYKHHKKKVIVLFDEYDTTFYRTHMYGRIRKFSHLDDVEQLFRHIYVETFHNNSYIERAVITGIIPIYMQELLPDVKGVGVYSIHSEGYKEFYGFTVGDLYELILQKVPQWMQSNITTENITHWYKGYLYGGIRIYNPWSIMQCIKHEKFDYYWIKTCGFRVIFELVELDFEIQTTIPKIRDGGTFFENYAEYITFTDMKSTSCVTRLLFFGYLTLINNRRSAMNTYELVAPNPEIRHFYHLYLHRYPYAYP